jgi:DNA modification methylase
MSAERVVIGNAELWHGDCREVLPGLPKHDLLLTDPPYGINVLDRTYRNKNTKPGSSLAHKSTFADDGGEWDHQPPPADLIDAIREACKWQAIFGGNYFGLPASSCWLVWDKLNGDNDFADCELAWTNWPKAVRRIQWRWNGMLRQGNEARYHPTQKPLQVMVWAMGLAPASETVLDPFMGSGTTGVACAQLGKQFTGIERERKYFDIACERISRAQAQGQMFPVEESKPEQLTL